MTDDPLPAEALGALGCLTLAAVFSLAQYTLAAYGPARARKALKAGHPLMRPLAETPERLLLGLRLGKALSLISTTALLHSALASLPLATPIVIVATTCAALLFVLALPWWIASPGLARTLAAPMLLITRPWNALVRPLTYLAERLGEPLRRRLDQGDPEPDSDEVVALLLNNATNPSLDPGERERLRPEIVFGDTIVREVMVPRNEVITCSLDTPHNDLLERFASFSRIPVYDDTHDHVLGLLYAKDVLRHALTVPGHPCDIRSIPLREPFFVPESRRISDLFNDLRHKRIHIAIVIDEFGGFAGIVTLEDIIEEFFGDIQDEYDAEEDLLHVLSPDHVIADARLHIDDLALHFNLDLPEDRDYETLAGFINVHLGRVPRVGATLNIHGLHFVVREATPRRAVRVEIWRLSDPPSHPDLPSPHTLTVDSRQAA